MSTSPWRPRATADGPLVCGHRGASAIEPENTVAAAVAAASAGATWVEFDVRPAADGLVIHHDPVTASGHRVATTAAAELDASIPDFATFIDACGPLGLDIELKTDEIDMSNQSFVEMTADAIDAHCSDRTVENMIVTSFDMDALDRFRAHCPEIATGVLFHNRTGKWAIKRAIANGHTAVVPWFRLVDARMVDAAHEAGLGVATWTVNSDRHVASMARAGVDMIIGDDPGAIRQTLEAGPAR